NEADCLVPNMETESVSSHLPPELNRSPITARAVSSFGPERLLVAGAQTSTRRAKLALSSTKRIGMPSLSRQLPAGGRQQGTQARAKKKYSASL
ncbi:hypothetical protein, partial [Paraburkholderia aspalathi]|uniref:hypothetical protein n=1 Tax=Paraburkholderia aspalathi TaxID=1324617 RepID=UPI001BA88B08